MRTAMACGSPIGERRRAAPPPTLLTTKRSKTDASPQSWASASPYQRAEARAHAQPGHVVDREWRDRNDRSKGQGASAVRGEADHQGALRHAALPPPRRPARAET